ncbi:type II toxin-antitoxin system Phd/YefM family antitoxin [Gordonia polyisoprenivorans]|uniref:type II toxin-antitoxin system Phd/YefM family antitoxin n=1 Tax=Gordonia polyisoprenivorans TaxID=84595 RepID=UPI00197A9A5C|nr:hypothetical protein [Gordonia polyisoprenivorans]
MMHHEASRRSPFRTRPKVGDRVLAGERSQHRRARVTATSFSPLVIAAYGLMHPLSGSTKSAYAAWQETAYLFRSPANARRLVESYTRPSVGQTEVHDLDRTDEDG